MGEAGAVPGGGHPKGRGCWDSVLWVHEVPWACGKGGSKYGENSPGYTSPFPGEIPINIWPPRSSALPQGVCFGCWLGWTAILLFSSPMIPHPDSSLIRPLPFCIPGFRIPLKLVLSITTAVIAVYQVMLMVKCQEESPPCLLGFILWRQRSPEVIAMPQFWLWGWY